MVIRRGWGYSNACQLSHLLLSHIQSSVFTMQYSLIVVVLVAICKFWSWAIPDSRLCYCFSDKGEECVLWFKVGTRLSGKDRLLTPPRVFYPISFVESRCDPSHSMVAWCSDQDNFDLELLYFFHEHQWGFCMAAVSLIGSIISVLCCWLCLIPCLTSSLPLRTVHAAYAWRESLMRLLSCFYFCFHVASLMDIRLVSKSNLIAFKH